MDREIRVRFLTYPNVCGSSDDKEVKAEQMQFKQLTLKEKKEEIWLSPMTQAPTPTEKSKKQRDNTKTPPKNFDYTTITDRLSTVSWGNDSTQPVWLNRFTGFQPSY